MDEKSLRHLFIKFLEKIKRKAKKFEDFSGIGILVYQSSYLSKIPHFSLRPTFRVTKKMTIGENSTLDFLLQISKKRSKFHDGFHFFNENGELTHISQYFVPPIRKIKPNESHGMRYHVALLGSYIRGVIFTAVILEKGEAFLFSKGKIFKL